MNGEEITESFYKKELQKTNQKEFRIEKVLKRNGEKLYVKWKGHDNRFNSWADKKLHIKMSEYFPELFRSFGKNVYATKTDLKNIAHPDTSSFALKANLTNLKTEVDKLGIVKLVLV